MPRSLRQAGFSLEVAAHAYSILDSYVYGFTLDEHSLPLDTSEKVAQVGGDFLLARPANAYPKLADSITRHARQPGYN